MVPAGTPIAQVDGVFNAVVAEGDFVGSVVRGAAAPAAPDGVGRSSPISPTSPPAGCRPPSGSPTRLRELPALADGALHRGAYYVRLMVLDKPGVFADIAAILRDNAVSMEAVLQRARAPGEAVPVVLITHEAEEAAVARSLRHITELNACVEPPRMIRIETL